MYDIRSMWILVYFKDMFIVGNLRKPQYQTVKIHSKNYLTKNVSLVKITRINDGANSELKLAKMNSDIVPTILNEVRKVRIEKQDSPVIALISEFILI